MEEALENICSLEYKLEAKRVVVTILRLRMTNLIIVIYVKKRKKYTQELDSITKEMDSYMDKLEKNTKDSKKGYKL